MTKEKNLGGGSYLKPLEQQNQNELENKEEIEKIIGSMKVKRGLAQMLKGGVIMDVTSVDQAKIAESAGAVAVMALEKTNG